MSNHTNNNRNYTNNPLEWPGPFPHMATFAEENEWLIAINNYDKAEAAADGFRFHLAGMRNGSRFGSIIWWIKETATDRLIADYEDRMEALKALDALEAQS